jgi:hypothetical protein
MLMHAVSSLRQSIIGGSVPLDLFISAIILNLTLPVPLYAVQLLLWWTMTSYSSGSQHEKLRKVIPEKKIGPSGVKSDS